MTKTLKCPRCNRMFAEPGDAYQHIKRKHGRAVARHYRDEHMEDDRSIAEQMVEAEIARARGEPVEDWLADMLPDRTT